MTEPRKSEKPQSFEKSLARLEAIVEKLESGEVDLEKSIGLYEQGRRIGRECLNRLEQLEKRVQIVREDAQGELQSEEFEHEEDGH